MTAREFLEWVSTFPWWVPAIVLIAPAVIAVTALAASPELSRRRRQLAVTLAAVTQIAVLLLPPSPHLVKVPSIPELVGRVECWTRPFPPPNNS